MTLRATVPTLRASAVRLQSLLLSRLTGVSGMSAKEDIQSEFPCDEFLLIKDAITDEVVTEL